MVLGFVRNTVYDVLALVPLAVLGVWYAQSFAGGAGVPASDATVNELNRLLLDHHAVSYFPTVIALLLCLVVLRTGRRAAAPGRLRHTAAVAQPVTIGGALLLAALAAVDLVFIPGGWLSRFPPVAVAAAWAWFVRRRIYGRQRLWLPTRAGFRPPLRMLFGPRSRAALRLIALAEQASTFTEAGTIFTEAARHPGGRSDPAWQDYCLVREVDHALAANRLARAEELLGGVTGGRRERRLVLSARGLFERAVGRTDEAYTLFRRAAERPDAAVAGRRRPIRHWVPYRLRTLCYETAAQPDDSAVPGADDDAWNLWTRTALLWNRQYTVVVLDLVARLRRMRLRDPELALCFAPHLTGVIDALGAPFALADLDPWEARNLQLLAATAYQEAGHTLAARHRYRDAVHSYLAAASTASVQGDRPGRGTAFVLAGVTALRLAPENAPQEKRRLDIILHGLQEMERDRGLLRDTSTRFALAHSRDELHAEVLDALVSRIRYLKELAAELALWLLESVRRNALSDAIRLGLRHAPDEALRAEHRMLERIEAEYLALAPDELTAAAPDRRPVPEKVAAARAAFDKHRSLALGQVRSPEPVDLASVRRGLGQRTALYYDCRRTGSGWRITTVLTAMAGITLHRSVIDDPGGSAESHALTTVGGLMRSLDPAYPDRVAQTLAWLPLDAPVWAELARVLLPNPLAEALHNSAKDGRPVLIIVPDQELSMVPFAGLRLAEGAVLAEVAAIVFQPNLAQLASRPRARVCATEPPGAPKIVAHVGPTHFRRAFQSARAAGPPVEIIKTTTRQELIGALTDGSGPDLVVVSNHGDVGSNPYDQFVYLRDGRTLSALTASMTPWPDTVVVGSCWSGRLPAGADEPFGLATACLLGGATNFVGGIAPVDNDRTSAAVLAEVVLASAHGTHPAVALHDVIARQRTTGNPLPPATQWATLAVWSTRPPGRSTAPPSRPYWTSQAQEHDLTDQVPRMGQPLPARGIVPDLPPSSIGSSYPFQPRAGKGPDPVCGTALYAAIAHGAGLAAAPVLTTARFLAGVAATDSRTWSALGQPGLGRDVAGPATEPPVREDRYGGIEVDLGDDDHYVTATPEFAAALDAGQRLAYHLGNREVTPAHVVYGILSQPDSDGSRWLNGSSANGSRPLELLGDQVFGRALPPARHLAPSAWGTSRAEYPLMAGRILVLLGYLGGKKLARLSGGVILLLILAVTLSLHSIYDAPSVAGRLSRSQGELTGTVSAFGHTAPAVLIGRLGDYRPVPAMNLLGDRARATLADRTPAALVGIYLYVLPANGLPPGQSQASMRYRDHDYPATLTCAGALSTVACLATVRLPSGTEPHLAWSVLRIEPQTPGPLPEHALLLVADGPAQLADLTAVRPNGGSGTGLVVTVRPQRTDTVIRAATPVVLAGHSRDMPLLGIAIHATASQWTTVLTNDILRAYAQGMAGLLAGPPPGSTAYAGLDLGPADQANRRSPVTVADVRIGSPADLAGIEAGDQITAVDHVPVTSPAQVTAAIRRHHPGDSITLDTRRGTTDRTAMVVLGYIPLGGQ